MVFPANVNRSRDVALDMLCVQYQRAQESLNSRSSLDLEDVIYFYFKHGSVKMLL